MKHLFLLFMVGAIPGVRAQEGNARYAEVARHFQEAYNSGEYDQVYGMFDAVMQQELPAEKLALLFGQQVKPGLGLIREMELNQVSGSAHIYKSTFEKGVMDISISLNADGLINGLYLKPHSPVSKGAELPRNTTPVRLPFNGTWFVYWGGETEAQNYHMKDENQQYAYDFLKVADGKSYQGDPGRNESYLAFGQPIVAPCDATVVLAIDGVPDNAPGEVNPIQMTGNTLVLKTRADEFILLAHLKEGSLKVKKGQQVRQGDLLALCGNSGNSTEAHLHLQLQNTRDFHKATGARLFFEHIRVNGESKRDYLPVKEDFVENIN